MNTITENVDVVVVGAGHAGCEAALACARLGLKTQLFTVSVESIAMMPLQPEYRRNLQRPSGERAGCAGRRNGQEH